MRENIKDWLVISGLAVGGIIAGILSIIFLALMSLAVTSPFILVIWLIIQAFN